jgi:uncharacterized protein (DUF488 family)
MPGSKNPTIYGIGYEGLTLDQFVRRLSEHDVEAVVDVRLTPSSRRPGFSKKKLAEALDRAGISYVHERDLGNPPENRSHFRGDNPEPGRKVMKARLNNGSGPALKRLVDRAANEKTAVLCVERFQAQCHRQVILEMAVELNRKLRVVDIW